MVLAAEDVVSESLLWDARRKRLAHIHRPLRRWQRPSGDERHICRWNSASEPEPLVEVEPDQPDIRLNEGVAGPDAAFWVETILNNIAEDDSAKDIPQSTGRMTGQSLCQALRVACPTGHAWTRRAASGRRGWQAGRA